jgi:rhamnulose-1-phosphate aldolase/alcohol dehydrogenase
MRDPNAVIYLVPGVGMISFARDKTTARQAGEFYVNAINVMRGASSVSTYVALPEQEAFNIEYWLLEEAKLQRMPKPKPLVGRVALVTGGAGGIGSAIADRLMSEGAVVMIADLDGAAAEEVAAGFRKKHGRDAAHPVVMDVTKEEDVIRSFAETVRLHGGIDIVVNNAGISSAAAIEDTTLDIWNHNMSILATGYFLVAREGYRLMKTQKLGGSMIFIGSKNGVSASAGATAYCTAKAAEIHLARCMALEGAPLGIRINVVNPDAVLRGSKIWQGEWRQQRAANNKISEDDLEEFYRNRSLLKRSVFPEDVAEAVHFFANEGLSGKSTGNFLNVDAGNVVSFTR